MDQDFYNLQRVYSESYTSGDQTNFSNGADQGLSNGRVPANGPGNGQTQALQSTIPSNGDLIDWDKENVVLDAFREKIIEEIEKIINSSESDDEPYARKVLMKLRSIIEDPLNN